MRLVRVGTLSTLILLAVGVPLATAIPYAAAATPFPPGLFIAHLSAAPGASTRASGIAIFRVNPGATSISYLLVVTKINNVFMAHIHLSPSANIAVWLYPNPNTVAAGGESACLAVLSGGPIDDCPGFIPGTFSGVLAMGTITSADLSGSTTCAGCSGLSPPTVSTLVADMIMGQTFVNVHTQQNPGGEIQGTIKLMTP